MRVAVYPADEHGCGAHRLRWPAEALARAGHDVTVVPPAERRLSVALEDVAGREVVREVRGLAAGVDVVVLQRVTHRTLAAAVPVIREAGVAVVIDVDDDLAAVDPRNPAFHALRPGSGAGGGEHSWRWLRDACREATLVTVSSDALAARYGRHGRVRVLRNRLAAHYYDVASAAHHYDVEHPPGGATTHRYGVTGSADAGGPADDREALVVGWPATLRSHPGDLDVAAPALRRLLDGGVAAGGDRRDVRLRTATLAPGVARVLGWPAEREAELLRPAGPVPLPGWPAFVADADVVICPLADTRFNHAKSHLKPLEAAAVGVPWVGSPRAEYRRLHAEGCGLLVGKTREWEGALKTLLTSPARRRELAEAGREVARRHRLEDHAWRWAEAWADAVALARGTRSEVSA